jgi:hypothetical protein
LYIYLPIQLWYRVPATGMRLQWLMMHGPCSMVCPAEACPLSSVCGFILNVHRSLGDIREAEAILRQALDLLAPIRHHPQQQRQSQPGRCGGVGGMDGCIPQHVCLLGACCTYLACAPFIALLFKCPILRSLCSQELLLALSSVPLLSWLAPMRARQVGAPGTLLVTAPPHPVLLLLLLLL